MKKCLSLLIASILLVSSVPPLNPVEAKVNKEQEVSSAFQKEVEIVSERTESSKVFLQEDGAYRMDISSEPIHMQNEQTGQWEEIDNNLQKQEKGRFHNKKNDFDASFSPVTDSADPLVSIEHDGNKVEITNISKNEEVTKKVNGQSKGNKITYSDIYAETDLSYTVGGKFLKEDIILKEQPEQGTPLEYHFEFNIHGLKLEEEAGLYYLTDKKTKERVFSIEKPFMIDSAVPEGFVSNMETPMPEGAWSDQIEMEASQRGNALNISIKPDMDWLFDSERVYPVTIDPTIKVYQPKNDLNDTTIRSALPDTTGGADTELGAGLYQSGSTNNIVRSLIQFDTGTLPKGAKVMSAQLNLRLSSVSNNTSSTIQLFEMGSAWEENRATWNRRTLSALWTAKGGDYKPTSLSMQTVGALDTSLTEPPLFKWPISADIAQKWVEQPAQNIGLMVKAQNETLATYKKFYSGDASGTTGALKYSPKLSIVYYPVSRLVPLQPT